MPDDEKTLDVFYAGPVYASTVRQHGRKTGSVHGGPDAGACQCRYDAPSMNLASLAQRVRPGLQKYGYDVIGFRSLNTILSHHGIGVVLDVYTDTCMGLILILNWNGVFIQRQCEKKH